MGKRNTYATGAHSNQRDMRSPLVMAARFLANTARRFLSDKALPRDVDEAIAAWSEAQPNARAIAEQAVVKAAMGLHRLRVAMGNINPDDPFDAACAALAKLEVQ